MCIEFLFMMTTCCHCQQLKGEKPPKMIELFAGIGGWHYAVEYSKIFESCRCGRDLDVLAIDINDKACGIYKCNFSKANVKGKSIESFDVSLFEGKPGGEAPAILAMSPPCQPFTRIGLKKDLNDNRSGGLKRVCGLLKECRLDFRPRLVCVENVAGFETSAARDLLIETLLSCGYEFREYLLSPYDFGIPNARLRYYLAGALCRSEQNVIGNEVPAFRNDAEFLKTTVPVKRISDFIVAKEHPPELCLSVEKHGKYLKVVDIVKATDSRSTCFTSSYARYLEGTGSILNTSSDECGNDLGKRENLLHSGQLRFFSAREIANIMCFPPTFVWPEICTDRQLFKCLGNSINCLVASRVVRAACDLLTSSSQ